MTELNMLRVPEGAKQLGLNTAHKNSYNQAPQYLQEDLKKRTRSRTQHTKNNHCNFVVPNVKGNEGNTVCFNTIKD